MTVAKKNRVTLCLNYAQWVTHGGSRLSSTRRKTESNRKTENFTLKAIKRKELTRKTSRRVDANQVPQILCTFHPTGRSCKTYDTQGQCLHPSYKLFVSFPNRVCTPLRLAISGLGRPLCRLGLVYVVVVSLILLGKQSLTVFL